MNSTISIFKLLGMSNNKTTLTNSDLDLLEAKLPRNEELKAAMEDSVNLGEKEIRMKTFFTVEDSPTDQIISSVEAAQGGKLVHVRSRDGQIHVRIQYTREEMVRFGQSPLSALAPAAIKNIVEETPELIADFPLLHAK